MKNVKEITKKELESLKAITFDIDGVIIHTGTELRESADGTELYMKSKRLSRQFIDNLKKLKKYLKLNFSSGRNILYLRSLVNEIFDQDVFLQAENGNISWFNGKITHPDYPADYFDKLKKIKERIKTMMLTDKRIRGFEPKMFILTTHCEQMEEIPKLVKEFDPENELYCLWTNEGYDIGSKIMNKGKGIINLAKYLKVDPKQIITTGNNYNDAEMLKVGKGVTVQPDRVEAEYFIEHKSEELGGELLVEFLLERYKNKKSL
ncbi:MAG: HAD hydrolase family protein [Candidatus Nealsonbacteria bacterium]|nr:HAD hydrolase family protein [Candidatus Nealsonbacteria bacterium]